jgi:dipeptidyl aminopeptidase/acylaminoacyl peptidase
MHHKLLLLVGGILLSSLPASLLPAQQKHALGIEEFVTLPTVGDPQVSPDGKLVAYTISTPSLQDNRSLTRIWVARVSSGKSWELETGAGSARAPRWSPDGQTVAFIADRDGGPQIWRIPVEGGPPTKTTAFEAGISDYLWAPDGQGFYFWSDLKWPDSTEVERRNGRYPTDARIWSGLFYRHWNEWRTGIRSHLFRFDLDGGSVTDLTPFNADVPPLALGGRDIALSPNGREIAFVSNRDSVVATSTNNDVFTEQPNGGGIRAITTSQANDNSPLYSPDGKYLAYLAMTAPGFEADRQQVMLVDRMSRRSVSLTPDWPLSVGALQWTPDSRALIAEVEERGGHGFYRIVLSDGKRTLLVTGGVNTALQVSPTDGRLVFLRQSHTHPAEVYLADADGRGVRQLTHVHDQVFASLDIPPLEPFGFVGALGDSVHGWIAKPPAFDPNKKYPIIYLIHGGPQGAWLDEWHARWNYALFAARGYVVAAVNFHGSTGYGQDFTNSISQHWGDYPYEDLMKGLDVVSALPYVDPNRIGAAGASYGGYMIYWLAGHTDRFRALIAHDGVFNPLSMSGSTEELWFPLHEFGGSQLDDAGRATMERWSPANYIGRWQTPMLVIHSQNDFRVDVSEGYQAFTALRLRGVPGKFLYFPDEDHWVLKPRNRRIWWGTTLDWMDQWLTAPGAEGGAPHTAAP